MYEIIFPLLKNRCLLALSLILLVTSTLLAQRPRIDSLKDVVATLRGIDQYDPIVQLVREFGAIDNNESLKHAHKARAIALQFGDSAKIVGSSRMIGQLLNRLAKAKEAEMILLEVLPIARRNDFRGEYKNILSNLALAYTVQAKYDKALETNFQTLILREEDNDLPEISISLNNIGLVYFKLKNFDKALEHYERALQIKTEIKDAYFLDRLFINIGLCHNYLNDYLKAQEYFDRAFKACANNCSDQIVVEGELGLGISLFHTDQFIEAKQHLHKSYAIAKKLENRRFQAENLSILARIYSREQDSEAAIQALTECELISRESGYNEILIDVYKEFAEVFSQLKNYEKASQYQMQYIDLKDSVYSGELINNLARAQTNYAERENLKTIATKNEVIARQRSLNIAIVIIAILAALLVFVLFRSNRTKKKVNQALSDAKAIIEDQNRQLLSSNYSLNQELKEKNIELQKANESLLRVNEELDNFIYKTSHDIRGPLASLKGMCNVALMDVRDPLALSYLHKLDITAEKLNTILTRLLIVNQINNSTLASEKIDFAGIVNDVLTLEKKKGLPPRLKIRKHIDSDISFQSDKQFVRIILENLIDNAIKFYNDSERVDPFVSIDVTEKDDQIRIKVVDNGIGVSEVHPEKIFQMFSRASERSETGGIGLYITKTATEKLGGAVNLKTTPEGFTEFFVTLPLASTRVMA